jgi:predicted short-subunit dehydrogenase-like oxidoreductase (DUF2520 family)
MTVNLKWFCRDAACCVSTRLVPMTHDRRLPTRRGSARPSITLIGPGNLGRVLGLALHAAGYPIDEVVSRDAPESRKRGRALARQVGARAATYADARLASEIVWLCVSDDAIAPTASALVPRADWKRKIALHSSGARSSRELALLGQRGAAVGSLHPMQTFVRSSPATLAGVSFAVEGDPAAVRIGRRIARDLGGSVFTIRSEAKVLYHAIGSFCSPMIIATLATAERIARAADIPPAATKRIMHPILRQTIANYLAKGPAAAFSGPINRADVNTVRKHLEALREVPAARDIYLSLARSALRTLPVRHRKAVRRVLAKC